MDQTRNVAYDIIMDSLSTIFSDVAVCISKRYGVEQDSIVAEMNKTYIKYSGGASKIKKKVERKAPRAEEVVKSLSLGFSGRSFGEETSSDLDYVRARLGSSKLADIKGSGNGLLSSVTQKEGQFDRGGAPEEEAGTNDTGWIAVDVESNDEELFWNRMYGIDEEFLVWSPAEEAIKYVFANNELRKPTKEDREKFGIFGLSFSSQ